MNERDFNDFIQYMEGVVACICYEHHKARLNELGYDAPADPLEAMRLFDAIVVEGKEPNLAQAKRMVDRQYDSQV